MAATPRLRKVIFQHQIFLRQNKGRTMFIRFCFEAWLLITLFIHSFVSAAAQPRGKWEIRAPMPSARTEVAAVELGGKIYVMGGYEKGGDLLEEYNPGKTTCRPPPPLPRPFHHVRSSS